MSSSHRIVLEPTAVLHHRPYRDTSVLLELFTREHGRVGAIARGVRTEKSRWAGSLQAFRPLLVSWSGRGELVNVNAVEENGPALPLTGTALTCGFYVNELLMRLLQRNDPHTELFTVYWDATRQLGAGAEPDVTLRVFEKQLLRELGYGLQLEHAADGGAQIDPGARYSYEIERGPVAYNERSHGVSVLGSTLISLARDELRDDVARRESKRLMRAVLGHYLGDKPLHSRELIQRTSALSTKVS
jgi:DNA repair protein RecO (recombination protein O)